ncbi:MAG: adenosine deaminase [Spirochaetes bacterium]|nr:adenosine deaminase [Spirochaetota bacterium]
MEVTHEILKKIPKLDLHRHLDGALSASTIKRIARKQNYTLPTEDPDELAKYVQVSPYCRSLAEFLKAFETFYPLLMNPKAMEIAAYEVSRDCFEDNVKYCELRFAPVLQAKGDYSMEEILDGVLTGCKKAHDELGIINPLILCCYRSETLESSIQTVNLALKYRHRGIVAVDLAGDEEHFPAKIHKQAFDLALKNHMPVTIHAGEAGGSENIKEAINVMGATRIGHGIKVVNDPELYQEVKVKQIPLEMCLTSNVQTTVASDYISHPFEQCYRDGLKVTINTDDPGVSHITLTDEYFLLKQYYHFSWDDIIKIASNSLTSSFTTEERKEKLRSEMKKEMESILEREVDI